MRDQLLSRAWLFCDPMDSSSPGSSDHGLFQARTLEWVAISFCRDLPNPWNEPASPALAGRFFTTEQPGNPWVLWITQYVGMQFLLLLLFLIKLVHSPPAHDSFPVRKEVDLQSCVSFMYITKWFSWTYIYIFFRFFSLIGYNKISNIVKKWATKPWKDMEKTWAT